MFMYDIMKNHIILWRTAHRRVGRIGRQMQSCPSPLEMGAVGIWELE